MKAYSIFSVRNQDRVPFVSRGCDAFLGACLPTVRGDADANPKSCKSSCTFEHYVNVCLLLFFMILRAYFGRSFERMRVCHYAGEE
jgi:hypothetical protein